MASYRINTFGALRLATWRATTALAGSCKPLLGLLLTQRGRPLSRAQAAQMLWPDQSEAAGRRCLSTALWRVKQSAPSLIAEAGERHGLQLTDSVWVDAASFEHRARALLGWAEVPDAATLARTERALERYCGPYLAGIDAEWALIERQRLHSLYCDAIYALTMTCMRSRCWQRALDWGQRLAQYEPLREDVQRCLMLAQVELGNRAAAVQRYRQFAELLQRELGVPPMPQTQALHRALCEGAHPATAADAGAGALHPSVRRRIGRVRQALAASQRQLDVALSSFDRSS